MWVHEWWSAVFGIERFYYLSTTFLGPIRSLVFYSKRITDACYNINFWKYEIKFILRLVIEIPIESAECMFI